MISSKKKKKFTYFLSKKKKNIQSHSQQKKTKFYQELNTKMNFKNSFTFVLLHFLINHLFFLFLFPYTDNI